MDIASVGCEPRVMNDFLEGDASGADVAAEGGSGPDPRAISRGLATLLLIGFATAFAVQNSETVDVSFLAWEFSMSKILLMIVSAVVGILLWKLVARLLRRNRQQV
jgi:uncharacterized integral membrane protein